MKRYRVLGLEPERSGWYTWDGTWFKYHGYDFMVLVCFDVRTLNVINYVLAPEENAAAYDRLVKKVAAQISCNCIGFHADGDLGLLKVLSEHIPRVSIQVCSTTVSIPWLSARSRNVMGRALSNLQAAGTPNTTIGSSCSEQPCFLISQFCYQCP